MVRDYTQQEGIDYSSKFSPVIKATTNRIVLALVCRGWSLKQIDVSNVFLNGTLVDEVFMMQLQGSADKDHLSYVCKLNKSLYGLKQASRAWFHRLSLFLEEIDFKGSQLDSSPFIHNYGTDTIYILINVDYYYYWK